MTKKLNDDALEKVTGGTGANDIAPLDENLFPQLNKFRNNTPGNSNNDPSPAEGCFGEPGESPW